jgi:hypothetical protein
MRLCSFAFLGEKVVLGGEVQRGYSNHFSGYSVNAHCIGKWSYFERVSGSLLKSIEGRGRYWWFSLRMAC